MAQNKVQNYTEQPEGPDQWCWASTTISISLCYNPASSWTQCQLVNKALGRTDCCASGASTGCNQPWYPDKALQITGNLANILGPLDIGTIKAEVDSQRPISVKIDWYGSGSHNVTIVGYDDDDDNNPTVDIEDPFYGPSTHYLNSFPITYQLGGNWTASYLTKG
jgi:hypothetical protein